jgi:hypothetical protein
MSTNPLLRLRALLPEAPVLVGRVLLHNGSDDTSTIQLPSTLASTVYAAGLVTGNTFKARGRGVAIGQNAFVRGGVVESQAPDVEAVDIPIGRVV